MQFSVFGVPVKCTKDMFTQDKILWTIYMIWAQFWRMLLVMLGAALLGGSYFYFIKNFSMTALLLIVSLGILLYGLIIYIQYYVYFEKNFGSFKQEFLKGYKPKFWSWDFWKPYLIILITGFVVGCILGLTLPANIANGLSFMFGLFFQHICLHGETWGFVLISKQQPTLEKMS